VPAGHAHERVFAAAYDSVAQQHLAAHIASEPSADPNLIVALGRLRLETLLSQCLVLSDTQVLDGALMRALVHQGHLESMARAIDGPLPIEVRSRADSLEESLWWTYVDDSGGGQVRGFLPSGFSDGASVRDELEKLGKPPSVRGLPGVLEILRRAGVDDTEREAAEAAWRTLIDLCDSRIPVVRFDTDLLQCFDKAAARFPAQWLLPDLVTDEGVALLSNVVSLGVRRGRVHAEVDSLCREGGAAAEDAERVRDWFDQTYLRAQAFQHGSDFRSLEADWRAPGLVRQLAEAEAASKFVEVELSPGTLTYLGQAPPEEWQDLNRRCSSELLGWWRDGDIASLRRLAAAVDTRAGAWSGEPDRFGKVVKGLTSPAAIRRATAGVGLSAPVTLGLTNPWLDLAVGVTFAVVASRSEWLASGAENRTRVELTDHVEGEA
jgi:hypothetical protein